MFSTVSPLSAHNIDKKSSFVVIPRQYSIMIYGTHPTAYTASCQIFVCGDRGIMHSITGAHFYDHWMQPGEVDKLLAAVGVKSLEGYAVKSHAKLMARALRHVAKVSLKGEGKLAGIPMIWCVVESLWPALSTFKDSNTFKVSSIAVF